MEPNVLIEGVSVQSSGSIASLSKNKGRWAKTTDNLKHVEWRQRQSFLVGAEVVVGRLQTMPIAPIVHVFGLHVVQSFIPTNYLELVRRLFVTGALATTSAKAWSQFVCHDELGYSFVSSAYRSLRKETMSREEEEEEEEDEEEEEEEEEEEAEEE